MKKFFNGLAKSFIEGVVIVLPFGLTIALTIYTFRYARNILEHFFAFLGKYWPVLGKVNAIPYLNVGVVFVLLTCIGYIASTFLFRSLFGLMEKLMMRIPLLNILYSSIKDSASAFVDKFDKPVIITFDKELSLKRMGFVTQESLEELNASNKVAVYVPHSYAFSGDLFLVEKEQVEYVDMSTSEALRLILSGGLANIAPSKSTSQPKLNPGKEKLEVKEKVVSEKKSVN